MQESAPLSLQLTDPNTLRLPDGLRAGRQNLAAACNKVASFLQNNRNLISRGIIVADISVGAALAACGAFGFPVEVPPVPPTATENAQGPIRIAHAVTATETPAASIQKAQPSNKNIAYKGSSLDIQLTGTDAENAEMNQVVDNAFLAYCNALNCTPRKIIISDSALNSRAQPQDALFAGEASPGHIYLDSVDIDDVKKTHHYTEFIDTLYHEFGHAFVKDLDPKAPPQIRDLGDGATITILDGFRFQIKMKDGKGGTVNAAAEMGTELIRKLVEGADYDQYMISPGYRNLEKLGEVVFGDNESIKRLTVIMQNNDFDSYARLMVGKKEGAKLAPEDYRYVYSWLTRSYTAENNTQLDQVKNEMVKIRKANAANQPLPPAKPVTYEDYQDYRYTAFMDQALSNKSPFAGVWLDEAEKFRTYYGQIVVDLEPVKNRSAKTYIRHLHARQNLVSLQTLTEHLRPALV